MERRDKQEVEMIKASSAKKSGKGGPINGNSLEEKEVFLPKVSDEVIDQTGEINEETKINYSFSLRNKERQ